jgi:hypothetical protein
LIQLTPSLQHRHGVIWSGDPALSRPKKDATATEGEHAKALAAWEERFRVARERGDYASVVLPDQQPTIFTVAPMPRSMRDAVLDGVAQGRIGWNGVATLVFRLCVVSIDHLGQKLEIKTETDPITKKPGITVDIIDELDAAAPGCVPEIGLYIFQRGGEPPGK